MLAFGGHDYADPMLMQETRNMISSSRERQHGTPKVEGID
jgi:hypothetical protein